jgi:hypothetical protein
MVQVNVRCCTDARGREERGASSCGSQRLSSTPLLQSASECGHTSVGSPFPSLSFLFVRNSFSLRYHRFSPVMKMLTWVKLKVAKVRDVLWRVPRAPDLAFSNRLEVMAYITPFSANPPMYSPQTVSPSWECASSAHLTTRTPESVTRIATTTIYR